MLSEGQRRSTTVAWALALVVSAASAAQAAPRKRKSPRPPTPATDPSAPSYGGDPAPPASNQAGSTSTPSDSETPTVLLARARQAFLDLDYAEVLPIAEQVLAHGEATIDQRLDASLLHASALAIVGDPIEAEKPFRFLLRGRPDFELGAETPPKIMAVFRKVQAEERAIAAQLRELARRRTLASMQLEGGARDGIVGGRPAEFVFRLRDPHGAVAAIELRYRRAAAEPFSALALAVGDDGAWTGTLPGEWTASDHDYRLQYYVTTRDAAGEDLLSLGHATNPLAAEASAGRFAAAIAYHRTWWFWTGVAVLTVGTGATAWMLHERQTSLPEASGRVRLRE